MEKILKNALNTLDPPSQTISPDEIDNMIKQWFYKKGLNLRCQDETGTQIITFGNKGHDGTQKEQLTDQYTIQHALVLKVHEDSKRTRQKQKEQIMWKHFFQQNQTNKNKINAATVDKAIKILEHCSTEIDHKRKKNKTLNQQK